MKIPLIYFPKIGLKKFIHIERKYISKIKIIPLGCDCHPAYVLKKLNIREHSLPFDWLNTDPIRGLDFVLKNIKTKFSDFLNELYLNDKGNIVSKKYPFSEFIHEKKIIEEPAEREKFYSRITRFIKISKNKVHFIYNLPSYSLESKNSTNEFYNSLLKFHRILNQDQTLSIYLRFDESLSENKENCSYLFNLIKENTDIVIVNYIREKQKYGIWGSKNKYPKLIKSMDIEISQTFPRIYIS